MSTGTRQGENIRFHFDYPDGPFTNTFTWHDDTKRWDIVLRSRNAAGRWEIVATKTLVSDGG